MNRKRSCGFARIVADAPAVRAAFDLHPPTRRWWRVILWLHGKPAPEDCTLSCAERVRVVANGFRFYAGLYRLLAVLLVVASGAFLTLSRESAELAPAGAGVLAGGYLWAVSGLGYAGAREYASGRREAGRVALLGFLVMVVAFLCTFTATVGVAAPTLGGLPAAPCLLCAALLLVVGVGSYLIEIVYLAAETAAPQVPQ